MTRDDLIRKQAEIAQERDTFTENANRQIAAFNGALALLESLIAEIDAAQETEGAEG